MRTVLDIREDYHGPPARPGALRIPLGELLAQPERITSQRAYAVVGHDSRDATFAARWMKERGIDAAPLLE